MKNSFAAILDKQALHHLEDPATASDREIGAMFSLFRSIWDLH